MHVTDTVLLVTELQPDVWCDQMQQRNIISTDLQFLLFAGDSPEVILMKINYLCEKKDARERIVKDAEAWLSLISGLSGKEKFHEFLKMLIIGEIRMKISLISQNFLGFVEVYPHKT